MNAPRTNNCRQWYCIEIVDEQENVHSVLSLYADEATATTLLKEADARMPSSAYIYYWKAGTRPVSLPTPGYTEGPMARPDGPITH